MKRLVLVIAFLLLACGVRASGGNVHYESSGTSDFTITFKSMAQGFAVLASSNPITIIAKVGTTAVDTMTIEAGNSMFFYCPANNLAIDRTLATAVTINPTFNNSILPNLGISTTGIRDALSAPTPVSVSWNTIFQNVTMNDSASHWWIGKRTYPITAGANIDGAKAILLEFSWTTWQSGGTNAFTLWNVFAPTGSSGDTSCVTGINNTAMPDSIDCGDSTGIWKGQDIKNVSGVATILIPIQAGAGYHYIRMQPHSTAMNIYGLNLRSRIVW